MEDYESDNLDIILTQKSSKNYCEVPSSGYGGDIVDMNSEVVSLEGTSEPNFDIWSDFQMEACSQRRILYGNVEIEDISSDEEVDKL